jgi:hypothetical protein
VLAKYINGIIAQHQQQATPHKTAGQQASLAANKHAHPAESKTFSNGHGALSHS